MSCLLTQGFGLGCKDYLGGLANIYFGNRSDFATGVTIDGTTKQIDGLPTATIYRYEVARGAGNFQEVATPDETNGTLFYAQTVNTILRQMTATKRKELWSATRGNPVVFVQDRNGNILMVGRTGGCSVKTTAQSGQNSGDLNGYQIEITAEEQLPAELLEAYTTEPFDNFGGITVTPDFGSTS